MRKPLIYLGLTASKCLSAMHLWCEGVMYCSIIPVVGLKTWNCSKYKLLKSFLPHSCRKYSKSQSNWNMCSTQPNKTQGEKDLFFFHSQKYNCSHNHPSATSFSWPASDRLLTQVTQTDFCVTSTCLQSWSWLQEVLPHWNCVGSGVSCVVWPFPGIYVSKHQVSMHV